MMFSFSSVTLVFLFSTVLAAPAPAADVPVLDTIVDSALNDIVKAHSLLVPNNVDALNDVTGLKRRICRFVNGHYICHCVLNTIQVKVPEIEQNVEVQLAFNLTVVLNKEQDKVSDLIMGEVDIEMSDDDSNDQNGHIVGGFGKKFRKGTRKALHKGVKILTKAAKVALKWKARELALKVIGKVIVIG